MECSVFNSMLPILTRTIIRTMDAKSILKVHLTAIFLELLTYDDNYLRNSSLGQCPIIRNTKSRHSRNIIIEKLNILHS